MEHAKQNEAGRQISVSVTTTFHLVSTYLEKKNCKQLQGCCGMHSNSSLWPG